MYIKRTIESVIAQTSEFFPVVLITGPRQVGKTTVFEHAKKSQRSYVSLDLLHLRDLAQNDPALFLQRFTPPVLIDEIQYAPQLFPYIKEYVDRVKESGLFWLTGSQQFELMANVSESLAGRVGILKLQGLSQAEKEGKTRAIPFLPNDEFLSIQSAQSKESNLNDIFSMIWKGSYPKLFQVDNQYWELFYESYIQTYIEKDIRQLKEISKELDFLKFMKALAARTGQLLNYADIAKDVGVSQQTIKSWLSLLQSSGVIYLLPCYSNNVGKRAIKTPKVYFMDTGLAAYLADWKTATTLETGAMNGAFLETYIISEVVKSYWHRGKKANLFFYRDKEKREIDLLIEENGTLYPIEIKKKSNPSKDDIKHFGALEQFKKDVGQGCVLCFCSSHYPITENVNAIPISYL